MQVHSIQNNNTNFQGKVIIKNRAKMPNQILDSLIPVQTNVEQSSQEVYADFLKSMSDNNDVVIRLNRKKGDQFGKLVSGEKEYYNVSFSLLEENSLTDKLLDMVGLKKRKSIAHTFHTEEGIANRLKDKKYVDKLMSKFSFTI